MAGVMFKLRANPTFRAKVSIPVAGGESMELDAEFHHFTRSQLMAFSEADAVSKRTDIETLQAIMAGWHNVEEPFGFESLTLLTENYTAAAGAIVTKWMTELAAQRLGN